MYKLLKEKKFVICGTNVIESEEHVFSMAQKLKLIFEKYDVTFIFKTSFDKANRSSLNSYRGVGLDEGLRILKRIKDELNIPLITDIHEPEQAKLLAEVVDIIQIPAFLCRQTDLLKVVAETGKVVHVKKGQFCSAEQMHKCKEKLIAFGNSQVILCERGNSFGYQDLVVDPRNLIWLKSEKNLVSMDITHCLQKPSQKMADGTVKSGGYRELIPYMGKMALSLDVDGIFMEVHDEPDKALCDAPTQWYLDKLEWLLNFIGIKKKINITYEKFINYHYLFRNPCGEKRIINNVIFKLINNYENLIIVDGGYNIGEWSKNILENKKKNYKILAFEPNTKILKKDINNSDRIILINKGLSNNIDEIHVEEDNLLNSNNSESFTLKSNNYSNFKVKLTTLDSELSNYNFDNLIIKLDIESYEYQALTGLINNIEKALIIQFEYHNIHKKINEKLITYINFFKKYNFEVYIIGEYELLNISDNWHNGFDICDEEKNELVNKRPNYNGGNPNYNDINKSIFKKNYRPENINLLAVNKNKNLKFIY